MSPRPRPPADHRHGTVPDRPPPRLPPSRWVPSLGRTFARRVTALAMALVAGLALGTAAAQAPSTSTGWPADIELRRSIEPPGTPPPSEPATPWGTSTSTPEATRTPAPPRPAPGSAKARLSLSAHLIQDGEPIDQGLVWRVFIEPPPGNTQARPTLAGMWREPSPAVELAPGNYVINVAYGRAHLTRKIAITDSQARSERFVLNAGGLRVTTVLAGGEKPPDLAVSYDVLSGDADRLGGRAKLVAGLRPGLIVRLNAGLYHIVSMIGDANAVVSADVTVEAGKLTDAVLSHDAARVTLKLVTRAGGEAQADTQWAVHTDHGDLVRESQGALPTHILAAGTYVASARHGGRLYQRQFTVKPGAAQQVEVVIE